MAIAQHHCLRPDFPVSEVTEICKRWGISRLELFGSRARGDHHDDSDYDFLYSKVDPQSFGFEELIGLGDALEQLLGHKVELVNRDAIEQSSNPYRKKNILGDAIDVFQS